MTPGVLTFSPFNITDGSGSHLITQGYLSAFTVGSVNVPCFDFGTAEAIVGPTCMAGANPPNGDYFGFNFFPLSFGDISQPGTYSTQSDQYFVFGGIENNNLDVFGRGNLTLTVTETPEPTMAPAVAFGVGLMLLRLWRNPFCQAKELLS